MKKLTILAMAALVMLAIASCKSKQQVPITSYPTNKPTKQLVTDSSNEPCKAYGLDDEEYYREIGVVTNANLQSAKAAALSAAKSALRQRLLGEVVHGQIMDRLTDMAHNTGDDDVKRSVDEAINATIAGKIGKARVFCSEAFQLENGTYEAHVAIGVSVKEVIDDIMNKIEAK